jgi:selenium metabolism protein YedF
LTEQRKKSEVSNNYANTVLVLNHDGLGQTDTTLGHKLAANYFRTLIELGQIPKAITFYADGVKLVTTGTPCQQELAELAAAGVPLIACRTCLDYYGLLDQVVVGEIGNMMRIVEAQASAAKVITL